MKRILASAFTLAALTALTLTTVPVTAASKTISVRPKTNEPNAITTVFGSGWKGRVTFLVGPENSEAVKVGSAKADSDGEILYQKYRVPRAEGRYVLLACQKDCAIKRSSKFTVKQTLF